MLKDLISKMNVAGPSGVVSKTVQAAGRGDYLERRNYTGPKLTELRCGEIFREKGGLYIFAFVDL